MNDSSRFLIEHGAPFLFGAVLAEQLGLPLPALPWLLAAGALSADGKFNPATGLGLTLLACLLGDGVWFYLGRRRGQQVLSLLCRISLEPDSCVRRTQDTFDRYGWRGIVMAKFIPGLSTMVPPLAGMSKMSAARFLVVDGAGSVLYGGCFIALGFIFSGQIQQLGGALARVGGGAFGVILGLAAAYIAFKFWQRQRLLRELRMARITVDELHRMQNAGEDTVILDLRSNGALAEDGSLIRGAIHLTLDEVQAGRYELPRDREVVVYCSCPNEVTSARVALMLRRKGFKHVRPLLGGIDAWREQKYPETKKAASASKVKPM